VRPVASDDAAYFVVDIGNIVEAFLNLPADYLQFFRAEGQTVQKFYWHVGPNPRLREVVPRSHAATSHYAYRGVSGKRSPPNRSQNGRQLNYRRLPVKGERPVGPMGASGTHAAACCREALFTLKSKHITNRAALVGGHELCRYLEECKG
jgi:hypothetical protein